MIFWLSSFLFFLLLSVLLSYPIRQYMALFYVVCLAVFCVVCFAFVWSAWLPHQTVYGYLLCCVFGCLVCCVVCSSVIWLVTSSDSVWLSSMLCVWLFCDLLG